MPGAQRTARMWNRVKFGGWGGLQDQIAARNLTASFLVRNRSLLGQKPTRFRTAIGRTSLEDVPRRHPKVFTDQK